MNLIDAWIVEIISVSRGEIVPYWLVEAKVTAYGRESITTILKKSEEEAKALMTKMYSAMTEDGMYGSTLANSLNTNTDVEMSSFKNNTVAATGADIGCFDSKPYWNTLNSTWNNMYSVINYANDFLHEMENSSLFSLQIKEEGPTEKKSSVDFEGSVTKTTSPHVRIKSR